MNVMKTIHTAHMTNAAHIGYFADLLKRALANAKVSENLSSQITVMQKYYALEDEYYVLSQKNDKSALIAEADTTRDDCFTSYRQAVKAFTKMPDDELSAAAEKLWQSIKEHKIDVRENLSEENAKLTDELQELETTLAAQVTTLGLAKTVAKLKEANEEVKNLMYERNAEEATKIAGALRSARQKVDTAYQNFVTRLNALNVVDGDEAYDTFIKEQNEQTDYYKQHVLKKRKTAKKADTDTTTDSTATAE